MYFSLGGHPAFAVPFLSGEAYEDYFVEFEGDTSLDRSYIDEEGFFDGRMGNVMTGSHDLALRRDMFSEDALIFKDIKSRNVTLRSRRNAHTLSVGFAGFEYLGLWAKVGAKFLCIEPWLGCADTAGRPTEFKDKEGIQALAAGNVFRASIVMTVD